MRAQRGKAASFRLSILFLGCAAAWPAYGQHHHAGRKPIPVDDPTSTLIDLTAPDLPGRLSFTPSDLAPGDAAHSALSRIVADPGAILQAYAPVGKARHEVPDPLKQSTPSTAALPATPRTSEPFGPPKPGSNTSSMPLATASVSGADAASPTAPALSSEPPPSMPPASPPLVPDRPSAGPASSNHSDRVKDADAPTGGGAPASVGTPDARPAGAPASGPAVAQPPTVRREPEGAGAAVLDGATLRQALDAYVGAEPVPVAGRVSGPEQARFKERQAIQAVYAARGFAPFWLEDGKFNAKARSVLVRVDHAAEDGLDLRGSPVIVPGGGGPNALARSELTLTEAAVAYGNQASGGRVDPARIGAQIAAKPDVVDAARVLGALADAQDAGEALHGFNPPQKGYALLRAKLAELRQKSEFASHGTIPYGPALKPGMRDARVPLIRARFGLDPGVADADGPALVYDTQVAAAVADFQKAHHLPSSGILTARTIAALSGGNPRRLEAEIIANMEQWRWLPRDLGQNHIEVNIPDYSVNVMHGDDVFHRTRAVVGQVDKPTPVFSETMRFIIVNPYWNVPLSIVKQEMLPKLAADPDYFANHGYETVERGGITYVRQPPGDSNALGHIKFMFPNKYSVYLHDTNARALFGRDMRALSHGCVRVEAPFKLAEAVLGRQNGWTESRVKKLVGGTERTINLPQPLPIHIVYFTAFVDEGGGLQLRDDIYGYAAKVKAALGLAS